MSNYTDISTGVPFGANKSTIQYADGHGNTNPWAKLSRSSYPRTVQAMFAWASELWLHNGTYSEGIAKAVRYFLTDIEIKSAGDDDLNYKKKESYKKALCKNFDILRDAEQLACEAISHGNSFSTIYFPFERIMTCPKCAFNTTLNALMEEGTKTVEYNKNKGFQGTCPSCHKPVKYEVNDVKAEGTKRKANIIRLPLKHMAIKNNYISGTSWTRVNVNEWEWLKRPIVSGDMDIIAETPMALLDAISSGSQLQLNQDEFYHMKCETISDVQIELNGFGVPLFMSDFELAFMMVVLFKHLEAMSIDMVSPWRVLAPTLTGNADTDPIKNMNLGGFMQEVRNMVGMHRKNPTLISTLPYPIQQVLVGGDVNQLIPIEWYEYLGKSLLSNMGVPHEFQQSSLQGNAAPMIGYKIFERNWQFLVDIINGWLTWVTRKEGEQQKWEDVNTIVIPMSVHNDPETRMAMLNLAAAGQISWSTALAGYGKDFKEERVKQVEEAQWETDNHKKIEEKIENKTINEEFLRTPGPAENFMMMQNMSQGINANALAGQMGGVPGMPPGGAGAPMPNMAPAGPGGAPPPGAGGDPMAATDTGANTPESMMANAQAIAEQLMTSDHTTRRNVLSELKSNNQPLYAMVKMILDDMEQEASAAGLDAAQNPEGPPPM